WNLNSPCREHKEHGYRQSPSDGLRSSISFNQCRLDDTGHRDRGTGIPVCPANFTCICCFCTEERKWHATASPSTPNQKSEVSPRLMITGVRPRVCDERFHARG